MAKLIHCLVALIVELALGLASKTGRGARRALGGLCMQRGTGEDLLANALLYQQHWAPN